MSKQRLLLEYLESISGSILEEYPTAIRGLIRGRAGVYALYRQDRLYYVGLANNLMGRINSHLRDRHRGLWDRFSVYLTVKDEHVKELESLVLRIVRPQGNRVKGKFPRAVNLMKTLDAVLRGRDADNRARLLGGTVARRRRRAKTSASKGTEVLSGLNERRLPLRGFYKGKTYKASLRKDGLINSGGKLYRSPTAATRPILRRMLNGWTFWHFKKGSDWVPLSELRR
jgi:Restriction Enzyme Adenine Methylase Associated